MNLDWEVWEHESTTTTEAKSHRTMAINQSECFFWWYLHQTQIVPRTQFSDKYHMLQLFWILYNHQIVNHLLQLSFKKPNQKGLIPGIDLKLYIRGCSVFINDVFIFAGCLGCPSPLSSCRCTIWEHSKKYQLYSYTTIPVTLQTAWKKQQLCPTPRV